MSANATLISNVRNPPTRLQNADGTAFKSMSIAPPAAGTRVKTIQITSDDTSPRVLQFAVTIGGVDYVLGEVSIPAGSGTDDASNSVNGLNSTKMPGLQTDGINRWIDIANGSDLKVKAKTAVTAAKSIYLFTECGDFT